MKSRLLIAIAIFAVLAVSFTALWRYFHRPPRVVVASKKIVSKTPKTLVKKSSLPAVTKNFTNPKVVIVMDDFGYNDEDLKGFFAIRQPITLSILPNLPKSVETAEIAKAKGYEIILHLPLEPKDKSVKEEFDTIKTGMNRSESLKMLDQELGNMSGITGVSNHMGSKSTEELELMSMVMRELKKRNLYFFDSLTSPASVCRQAAKNAGVKYARRDVFLDIPNDAAMIRKRVLELRRLAFRKGTAIAVCHYRKSTIKVLNEMVPALAAEGIRFTRLSEMVK